MVAIHNVDGGRAGVYGGSREGVGEVPCEYYDSVSIDALKRGEKRLG